MNLSRSEGQVGDGGNSKHGSRDSDAVRAGVTRRDSGRSRRNSTSGTEVEELTCRNSRTSRRNSTPGTQELKESRRNSDELVEAQARRQYSALGTQELGRADTQRQPNDPTKQHIEKNGGADTQRQLDESAKRSR